MSQKPESFGKYILLEKLATGGMAEVYLAKSTGVENVAKFFAIKRILPQFSQNQEFVDMFKEEARIAINLTHSNIVTIIEFGEQLGQFYLVMEYVEGRNLRQMINKIQQGDQKLRIDHIAYIIKEVAKGLDHAHRCVDASTGRPLNISHRDISPQNVMLNFEGEVKICDFGIAKAESKLEQTQAGTLKGKFGYMSPEQAEGQEVDFRTDIFSLGIVLWELLAQDRLFLANNEMNTLRKIRDCQIPSLRKIDPNIPVELERITNKMLAKDRNMRHQSGGDVYRELSRFLSRHYPEFTSQDFGTFVKQVYAKEREEVRKKIVEYGKIQASSVPRSVPLPDSTQTLTDTAAQQKKNRAASMGAPKPLNTAPEVNFKSDSRVVKDHLRQQLNDGNGGFRRTGPSASPPLTPSRDSESFRSGSFTYQVVSPFAGMAIKALPLIMLVIIGLVANWYLRIHPEKMNEIRPYVDRLQGVFVGGNGRTVATNNGEKTPKNQNQNSASTYKLFVISFPSEAEIRINDVSTGVVTPGQVDVPGGESFQLSLHKEGYLTWFKDMTMTNSGDIKAELTKADFGYVDIHVRAGDGTVYVDDRKIAQKPPVYSLPIPAGRPVRIKAMDNYLKTYDEKVVNVKKDTKQIIYLFLKKPSGNSRSR